MLTSHLNSFLLLASEEDETHEDDSSKDECTGEDGGKNTQCNNDILTVAQRTFLVVDGCLLLATFFLQGINLVESLEHLHRVLPYNILFVRARSHGGITTLACYTYEGAIGVDDFVILLCLTIFLDELVDSLITLGGHAEGVVMTGLGVEQVFIQRVVGSGIGIGVKTANLLGGTASLAHSGVHLKALLGGGIAEVGALGVVSLLTLYDALVGSPQYVESLLVVVLAVIERRHPGSAVSGLVALSLCHKGIKCMQECAACLHIFLVGQEFLTLFH